MPITISDYERLKDEYLKLRADNRDLTLNFETLQARTSDLEVRLQATLSKLRATKSELNRAQSSLQAAQSSHQASLTASTSLSRSTVMTVAIEPSATTSSSHDFVQIPREMATSLSYHLRSVGRIARGLDFAAKDGPPCQTGTVDKMAAPDPAKSPRSVKKEGTKGNTPASQRHSQTTVDPVKRTCRKCQEILPSRNALFQHIFANECSPTTPLTSSYNKPLSVPDTPRQPTDRSVTLEHADPTMTSSSPPSIDPSKAVSEASVATNQSNSALNNDDSRARNIPPS